MGQVINPVTLERGLRANFMQAFDNGESPQEVMPLILQTTSDGQDEKYGWLGQAPNLEEWIDERKLHGLYDFDYTLTNVDYEATLKVSKNTLKDDRLGATKTRINDLARKAKLHPRKLFFDKIIAGTSDLCYDGQAFFSNSHSEGDSGTQDNLLAGAGTSLANLKTGFQAAEAAMMGFVDDRGEPLNEGAMDLYVVCPAQLKASFRELMTSIQIGSSSNALKGAFKLISSSRLADVDDWYLLDASGVLKPFIWQNRQNPEFNALEGNSTAGFMSKYWYYGIDYRAVMGYGLWQKAVKVVN